MRMVAQRVKHASVTVNGETVSSIQTGLMVLIGVEEGDTEKDAVYIADKICKLRVFTDENDKMNLSVRDVAGEVLLVSQFTLLGDARGQNRPGFVKAAPPDEADRLYRLTADRVTRNGVAVRTGRFRTHMEVSLLNDGPVTILLDSRKLF